MTDAPVNPFVPKLKDREQDLVNEIRTRYRGLVKELWIEHVGEKVILYGRANSFYGKQMAQEEAIRRGKLSVHANRITVANEFT